MKFAFACKEWLEGLTLLLHWCTEQRHPKISKGFKNVKRFAIRHTCKATFTSSMNSCESLHMTAGCEAKLACNSFRAAATKVLCLQCLWQELLLDVAWKHLSILALQRWSQKWHHHWNILENNFLYTWKPWNEGEWNGYWASCHGR